MPRVVHFEIHAEDPARAIRFYQELLGWQFTAWGGGEVEYWLIKTGEAGTPGIDGGLVRRRGTIDGQARDDAGRSERAPSAPLRLRRATGCGGRRTTRR